jgi:hypothetical protein
MYLSELLRLPDDPLSTTLQRTIWLVDSLHRFPGGSPFPIRVTKSRREQGSYQYLVRPNRPIRIELSRHAVFPALTLLHEVGHFLDHVALNRIKQDFGTLVDPMFEPLRERWGRSPGVNQLRRILEKGRRLAKHDKRMLHYQLTLPELWARTYVQWIVKRSREAFIGEQFERLRNEGIILGGTAHHLQWDDDEFQVIMLEVDRLFAAAGLT